MRTPASHVRTAALVCAAVCATWTWAAPAVVLRTLDGDPPLALEGVDLPADLQAVALASDGRLAAVAAPLVVSKHEVRSLVRIYTAGVAPPVEIEIPGIVRALLFDPDGATVYVLQHRPAGKSSGETLLLAVEVRTRKVRLRLRLPDSAQALESWPERRAILVASRNDLRTLELPDLRSGPLFRVPGDNLALAGMDGNRFVIGQSTALLLVDLDDRPQPDGMAQRAKIETPAAVVALAVSPGGEHGLVRLSDGRVREFASDLRELYEADPGWIARVPRTASAVADSPVETHAVAPTPQQQTEVESPEEEPAALSPPAPWIVEATPLPPPLEPAPPAAAPSMPPSPMPPEPPAPPSPPAPTPTPSRGTIEGDSRIALAVVFLGPDSVLREAARVVPGPDGGFDVPALPRGRYRVQLDGGGGRVLATDPPFAVLDVTERGPGQPLSFRILRAW